MDLPFDFDFEFNSTALALTVGWGLLIGWFFFADPLSVGMDKLPLVQRILGVGVGSVGAYFVGAQMLR